MNVEQLLDCAENTWPPTEIVLRTICNCIGTRGEIANLLRLGDYGPKRVSAWIAGHNQIPFSVWLTLLVIDNQQEDANHG